MQPFLRPVGIGLVVGFLSLFFGVVWAINLTVNHDKIHRRLSESENAVIEGKFVINSMPLESRGLAANGEASDGHGSHGTSHVHSSHDGGGPSMHEHSAPAVGADNSGVAESAGGHQGHDSPLMAMAHERLARGHLHAMGLGVLTICVSLVLSLIQAPARMKTLASASAGIGGLFYPLAWIIMGFRTPALGAEAAADSVFPIAALSILLVLIGVLLTLFYVIRGFLTKP
ncbi:MAG TPA: hypothetical protein VNK06_03120 [Thermodesulfobacteriota bacterium]|nr:hypothetical protein [Thermodesulfobacteriota bacterium]